MPIHKHPRNLLYKKELCLIYQTLILSDILTLKRKVTANVRHNGRFILPDMPVQISLIYLLAFQVSKNEPPDMRPNNIFANSLLFN